MPLARAAGWNLAAITQAYECDCSSLAGVCGIAAGTSTGTARIIAGEYKVVCSKLYVRSTPSRKLQPVADYSNGQRIYSVAADVVEAEGYVWAHYTAYSGATRYVAIGTADGSEKFLVKV